jgi:hypothetical protein
MSSQKRIKGVSISAPQPVVPPRKELHEVLDDVCDSPTLLVFVHALIEDRKLANTAERADPSSRYGPDAGGWENKKIDTFLGAAARWAEDTNFGELSPDNPWKQFAVMLYCGKIYE